MLERNNLPLDGDKPLKLYPTRRLQISQMIIAEKNRRRGRINSVKVDINEQALNG